MKHLTCSRIILFPLFSLIVGVALFAMIPTNTSASESPDKKLVSKWSEAVCRDLGCMSIGSTQFGVNLSALGLVQDKTVLEGFGFNFGEGPYRISATRIDTGRYQVSVQSMSRRNDHDSKAILLKTSADTIYPVRVPNAPDGKYTWNSAIQFDMEDQLGIVPHYEMKEKPVDFVDIRVVDPDKLARFGFTGYEKNNTSCQILYKGKNSWEFSPGNGRLMYENGRWSAKGTAAEPVTPETQNLVQNTSPTAMQTPSQESPPKQMPLADSSLLFANSDFEMGDLTNWTADGNAFDFQPTTGDNPTARGRKTQPSHHQGKFWIGTL